MVSFDNFCVVCGMNMGSVMFKRCGWCCGVAKHPRYECSR